MGHEYIRCHRAYRQLARCLARGGFPVLRFDFSGCGDSGGEDTQSQLQQWRHDIVTAIAALRSRYAVTQICLVGLRIGGTLAMLVGAAGGNIDGLVLWDPVVHGAAYLAEITTLHQETLRYFTSRPNCLVPEGPPTEILGFPLPDALRAELASLALLMVDQKPAQHILLIDSQADPRTGQLRDHLQRLGATVQYQHLPGPPLWVRDPYQALVPRPVLQAVGAWLAEAYA
jgi:pimeloyl-ACP methyl ester carboxylesterase